MPETTLSDTRSEQQDADLLPLCRSQGSAVGTGRSCGTQLWSLQSHERPVSRRDPSQTLQGEANCIRLPWYQSRALSCWKSPACVSTTSSHQVFKKQN